MTFTTAVYPSGLVQMLGLISDLRQMAAVEAHPDFPQRADEALVVVAEAEALKSRPGHGAALRELQGLLHEPSTRVEGLQALESLVQVLFLESGKNQTLTEFHRITAAMPPFLSRLWQPPDVENMIHVWKDALSRALFEELRHRHVLHPPVGPHDDLLFRVQFDPFTARFVSLNVLPLGDSDILPVDRRTWTGFVYKQEMRRFMLEDRLMRPAETMPVLPPWTGEIIDRLHGHRPYFAVPAMTEIVTAIRPGVFRRNQDYAERVLAELKGDAVSFEVSVAPDGAFVGFRYRTPDMVPEACYEVGVVGFGEMGVLAEVHFDLFRHTKTHRWLRVPSAFAWKTESKPNPFQKSALIKWKGSATYRLQNETSWSKVSGTGK